MAKALLSAFLQDLLENLPASQTKHILKKFKCLDQLKDVLLKLNALVDDAEEKQFTEGDAVKRWLNELQQNYYHLEELLGEITTKSSGPELQLKHDIRRFISSKKPYGEADEMKDSLRRIIENLEHLAKEKDAFGLRELVPQKDEKEQWQELIMLSAELIKSRNHLKDHFYGREKEKKIILETLLSKGERGGNIRVIKIIGAAGTGKTAFARFIYSNIKVTTFFHIREWVTIPIKSNVCSLLKKTLEAISESEHFSPHNDFNLLQTKLKNYLAGKKFLLVVDNCLIEDRLDNWDKLISSLEEAGAKGSAVILTTRPVEDSVLVPPAQHILPLDFPSTEDCWSIFQAHAFGRWKKSYHDELLKERVGIEIINKLGNQPLAAKMVGILFQDRPHPYKWIDILRSKFLHTKLHADLGIPLFLILCYLDLPGKLRLCLAYMSIFPKGYEFKQKDIIFLWMAQGFLHQSGKSMEEVGNEYFSFLLMRSFFQPSPSDGDSCIMHSLVHDLASYAFEESSKHHLTYEPSIEDFLKTFPDENSHLLRTILPLGQEPRHNNTLRRNVQEPENLQEIIRSSFSSFSFTNESEETTQEAVGEILSASTGSNLPAVDPPSLDTSIIGLDELSGGQLSPQIKKDEPLEVTFDIPNINISKNDIQSPFVEVDDPITVQAANTPDTAPHSEVQASSSEDSDDQLSSVEMFKVTTLSQLKELSPDLKSLKIEGFESLEALPDDLLSEIPTLQELHIVDCSSLKSFPSSGQQHYLDLLSAIFCIRLQQIPLKVPHIISSAETEEEGRQHLTSSINHVAIITWQSRDE
ncbi:hypothetical protein L6164_023072 [Bauhinia variegata]|uniref:Uncharacterized protein n=1 Tax=Bauhinia variegata TaxID=167791 RepID=A0ACB9MH57_BAUVA|nr:hypothetical protein L6164_023072 [Bauhinia variegata]